MTNRFEYRKKTERRKGIGSKLRLAAAWAAGVAAAACITLAFLISRYGGRGMLPTWQQLYRMAGISNASPAVDGNGNAAKEPTKIHFIDVGQGDAVLIEQDNEYAMIDCGTMECETALLAYLDQMGVEELKVLVMTHPHSDHIGSMAAVINSCKVDQLVLPQLDLAAEYPTASTFEKVISAAGNHEVDTVIARQGQTFSVGSGTLSVIAAGIPCEDYNNLSVCTMFTAGSFRFLDTGDAEQAAEDAMLADGIPLSATVMKAGHHGSSTSNTLPFLRAVRPQAVVVSCGQNNEYGHPHREALEHFSAVGAAVYRTDQLGSIVVGYAPETGVKIYTTSNQMEQDTGEEQAA